MWIKIYFVRDGHMQISSWLDSYESGIANNVEIQSDAINVASDQGLHCLP